MSQPPKAIQNSLASKIMDEELVISNEQITESRMLELIQLVKNNHPSLKTLKLNNCFFTTEIGKHGNTFHKPISIIPLLNALQDNNVLSTLNLDRNNETDDDEVSDQNAKAIGELLRLNKPNLTTLSLNSCEITAKRMQLIAGGLKDNTSLKTLMLANNPIQSAGAAALVSALENNRVLTFLDLSLSSLYAAGGAQIALLIKKNLFLKILILRNNRLDPGNEQDIGNALRMAREKNAASASTTTPMSKIITSTPIANTMGIKPTYESPEPTGLHALLLGENNLRMVTLIPAIKSYSSIRILNLSHNAIGDKGAKEIADQLLAPKLINSLNLRKCQIGLEGMKAISIALSKNTKDHKEKTEYSTTIVKTANATSQPLEEPADAMEQTELETLDLSQNDPGSNLRYQFAEEMAQLLSVNRSLKTLHFSHNGVGSAGFAELMKALKVNTSLETLSLDCNDIGYVGYLIEALTPSVSTPNVPLKYNRTLTSLSLSGNSLWFSPKTSGEDFYNMLRANTSLKIIDLSSMKFNVKDAIIWAHLISKGLKDNQTLESLNMSSCNIQSQGAKAILNAAVTNKFRALTALDLGEIFDGVSVDDTSQADELCRRNRTFRLTWGYLTPMMTFGRANYGNPAGSNGAALIPFLPQFRKLMGAKERDESPTFKDKQNLGRFITTAYYQSVIKGSQSPALQTQNANNKTTAHQAPSVAAVAITSTTTNYTAAASLSSS